MKPKNTPHRRAYVAKWMMVKQHMRRDAGLCIRCGAKPSLRLIKGTGEMKPYVLCDRCRKAAAAWKKGRTKTMAEKKKNAKLQNELYQERRRLGLCGKCGGDPGQRVMKTTGETVKNAVCDGCLQKAYRIQYQISKEPEA